MRLKIRGTVSRLWASTSGRDSKTCRSWSASPLKSGINSATRVDGLSSLLARTVCAYSQAPPSGRSSRATPVTVEYRKLMACTLSATPPGSSRAERGGVPGVGLPEVATPGAHLTADQKGGFAVFPAFVDVGAAGLFADGV